MLATTITFTIPDPLLAVLIGLLISLLLFLAVVGVLFLWNINKFEFWR